MAYQSIIMIVSAAALVALAASAPHAARQVDLMKAVNKTVCPISVFINKASNRVPARIKELKCASGATQMCAGPHGHHRHQCCNHKSDDQERSCVEIRDTVLVQYLNSSTLSSLEVSVGCSCMIEQSVRATLADEKD